MLVLQSNFYLKSKPHDSSFKHNLLAYLIKYSLKSKYQKQASFLLDL